MASAPRGKVKLRKWPKNSTHLNSGRFLKIVWFFVFLFFKKPFTFNHEPQAFLYKMTSKKPNYPSLPRETVVIVNVSLGVKLLFLSMESGGCFQQQLTQTSEFSFLRTAAALLLYPDLSLFSKVALTKNWTSSLLQRKCQDVHCFSLKTPPQENKNRKNNYALC